MPDPQSQRPAHQLVHQPDTQHPDIGSPNISSRVVSSNSFSPDSFSPDSFSPNSFSPDNSSRRSSLNLPSPSFSLPTPLSPKELTTEIAGPLTAPATVNENSSNTVASNLHTVFSGVAARSTDGRDSPLVTNDPDLARARKCLKILEPVFQQMIFAAATPLYMEEEKASKYSSALSRFPIENLGLPGWKDELNARYASDPSWLLKEPLLMELIVQPELDKQGGVGQMTAPFSSRTKDDANLGIGTHRSRLYHTISCVISALDRLDDSHIVDPKVRYSVLVSVLLHDATHNFLSHVAEKFLKSLNRKYPHLGLEEDHDKDLWKKLGVEEYGFGQIINKHGAAYGISAGLIRDILSEHPQSDFAKNIALMVREVFDRNDYLHDDVRGTVLPAAMRERFFANTKEVFNRIRFTNDGNGYLDFSDLTDKTAEQQTFEAEKLLLGSLGCRGNLFRDITQHPAQSLVNRVLVEELDWLYENGKLIIKEDSFSYLDNSTGLKLFRKNTKALFGIDENGNRLGKADVDSHFQSVSAVDFSQATSEVVKIRLVGREVVTSGQALLMNPSFADDLREKLGVVKTTYGDQYKVVVCLTEDYTKTATYSCLFPSSVSGAEGSFRNVTVSVPTEQSTMKFFVVVQKGAPQEIVELIRHIFKEHTTPLLSRGALKKLNQSSWNNSTLLTDPVISDRSI